jgi:hypothetical protein
MDLQINSKSHVPVHVQLEGQIKHLILAGRFEVGSRLPSIRALAGEAPRAGRFALSPGGEGGAAQLLYLAQR